MRTSIHADDDATCEGPDSAAAPVDERETARGSADRLNLRHVAVYGTLRQGGSNDITRLSPPPQFVGRTTMAGLMYHLGGYPGVVFCSWPWRADAPQVQCEVYAVSAQLERVLDDIEAAPPSSPDEYRKREFVLDVQTAQGVEVIRCFAYEINPRVTQGKPLLPSGDWMGVAHSG
jgi:gamma-glutamylcyclotransferase (GGCT)/AIG2-like uncharacterized protein YtfP